MRRIILILAAAMLVPLACDSVTEVLWGDPVMAIVEGREQTATAGDAELPSPVTASVWQDPLTGQAAMVIGPRPLYAQTSVRGVVGAVVCVGEQAIMGDPVIPHARCTLTESNGRATFHLAPPTRAGRHWTPIVAEVDGQALTPDTVKVEVGPGPLAQWLWGEGEDTWSTSRGVNVVPDSLSAGGGYYLADDGYFRDAYGNGIPADSVASDELFTVERSDRPGFTWRLVPREWPLDYCLESTAFFRAEGVEVGVLVFIARGEMSGEQFPLLRLSADTFDPPSYCQ